MDFVKLEHVHASEFREKDCPFFLKKRCTSCSRILNCKIHWQGHVKRISRELGNRKKWDERHMQHLPVKTQCFAHVGISCELGNRKKWDERHMQHLPVKTQCFLHFGISCELGNRKNGTGDRQEAFTCEKPMFCAVWNKISSMHIDVSTTEFGDQKMWKHQRARRYQLGCAACRTPQLVP